MTTQPLTPAGLRCAHKGNPLGVAPDHVRLSWMLEGAGTGRAQRAYQVLVTPEAPGASAVWDSGRVESAGTADIVYAGTPLTAGGRYSWKVRVWDEAGRVSSWSDPARFEVELDRTSGWHASWIGPGRIRAGVTPPSGAGPVDPVARALTPAPYLRRAFTVDQLVTSARLYVTALGLYEARLNGRRVGDGFLTPGWTDYTQRIAYQTYDVTGLLNQGDNVLGAILAHGWYAGFYGFDPKRARRPLRHQTGTAGPAGTAASRRQRAADRHGRAVGVLDRRDPARGPADGRAARSRARARRLGRAWLRSE